MYQTSVVFVARADIRLFFVIGKQYSKVIFVDNSLFPIMNIERHSLQSSHSFLYVWIGLLLEYTVNCTYFLKKCTYSTLINHSHLLIRYVFRINEELSLEFMVKLILLLLSLLLHLKRIAINLNINVLLEWLRFSDFFTRIRLN